jgi:hypothetical protein
MNLFVPPEKVVDKALAWAYLPSDMSARAKTETAATEKARAKTVPPSASNRLS